MAKMRRSLDKRQQASLMSFGVKRGVPPTVVNNDPVVTRPDPKVSVEDRLLLFLEKVLRHLNKKRAGRPRKLAFVDSRNLLLVECNVELGERLAASRDYDKDPRRWVDDFESGGKIISCVSSANE
ncbi:hypothetical protein CYMTET_55573 [Cymbomonas tetramitiformis]|uniref:Uncharacterized protein n=1 Tax=Cymbomonas tetramitiformis TaxID=36881 RepID=A0AAE0EN74_9CHLO|nr:hypothetical protein CYMTET_55573 [Cymbomonas tetramitiformis]